MQKILDWFQGNLSDKSTWIAICGVIVAFTNFTLTNEQIAAVAALGAILFTARDRHFAKVIAPKEQEPEIELTSEQIEVTNEKSLEDILSDDRKL